MKIEIKLSLINYYFLHLRSIFVHNLIFEEKTPMSNYE